VAALESNHRVRPIGEQIDDLALAFIAPLGADHHDIYCHNRMITLFNRLNDPSAVLLDQLAVASKICDGRFVAGQTHHHALA